MKVVAILAWLSLTAAAPTPQPPEARVAPDMPAQPATMTVREGDRLFAILWRPGRAWIAGQPVQHQKLTEHRAYWTRLSRAGRVFVAGPYVDAEAGGIALIRAATIDEARQIMSDDPAVTAGVFVGTLRPYYVVFGNTGPG